MIRLLLPLLLLGCAEELTLPDPVDDPGDDDTGEPGEPDAAAWFDVLDDADGILTVRIDATNGQIWRTVDLVAGAPVDVPEVATSTAWHLGASRFNLAINGGVSGPGGLQAAFVPGVSVEDAVEAPADGWLTDAWAPDSDPPTVEHALGDWYDYDPSTHVLTPKAGVYVIRGSEVAVVLQVVGYYDDAGNSGFPTLRWRAL